MAVPADGATTFRDELRGDITFEHNNVDDQVLLKSDGFPTYHLANVVDDHLMQITDVIRAEEWISSTPKHVLLYKAFGWQLPRFWHMPLLRNIDKSKISKRKNPVSLIYYRDAGFLPEAMLNFLGLMGGGMPADLKTPTAPKKFTLAEMVEHFVFTNIRLGGPVFDLTKLKWLNGEYLRKLSPEAFFTALRSTRLLRRLSPRRSPPLMQTRIETLGQFGDLTSFFFRDDVLPTQEVFLPKEAHPRRDRSPSPPSNSPSSKPPTGPTKPWSQPSKNWAKKRAGRSKKTSCCSAPSSPAAPCRRRCSKAWSSSAKPARSTASAASSTRRRNWQAAKGKT